MYCSYCYIPSPYSVHSRSLKDLLEETSGLKRHYENLKSGVNVLIKDIKGAIAQAFSKVNRKVVQLVETTDRFQMERGQGTKRMRESADVLDSIFYWLYLSLVGAIAGTVTAGVVAFFTAGLTAPAAALGAAALVGGVAAGAMYMRKKMKEHSVLEETNNWILRDRIQCRELSKLMSEYESFFQEMEAKFPNRWAMDEHLRQCGINAEELRDCYKDISEISKKWSRYGFGSCSEANTKRAEAVVHTFLQKGEYDSDYLSAVTLFLDLEKIGAIGYDVTYLKRKQPPIRDLLRIIADGLEADAEPAKRMALRPWEIPAI